MAPRASTTWTARRPSPKRDQNGGATATAGYRGRATGAGAAAHGPIDRCTTIITLRGVAGGGGGAPCWCSGAWVWACRLSQGRSCADLGIYEPNVRLGRLPLVALRRDRGWRARGARRFKGSKDDTERGTSSRQPPAAAPPSRPGLAFGARGGWGAPGSHRVALVLRRLSGRWFGPLGVCCALAVGVLARFGRGCVGRCPFGWLGRPRDIGRCGPPHSSPLASNFIALSYDRTVEQS